MTRIPRHGIQNRWRSIGAVMLAAGAAAAQPAPRATVLTAPTAAPALEFNRIAAIRELSDGRVLVLDEGDNRLVVLDMRSGAVREIGRQGGGAGEHGPIALMFPLGADSTLIPDARNGRWLLLHRDSVVAMIAGDSPAVRTMGFGLIGADSRGAIATTRPRMVGGAPRIDSLMILRGWRQRATVDTVGLVYVRPPTLPSGRIDPTKQIALVFSPLSSNEQALLFQDGWMAVARLAPYRVEWIAADGTRLRGPVLPFESVRVTDQERAEVMARESRESGRPPRDASTVNAWPDVVPAFLNRSLLAAGDGALWILRTPTRGARSNSYDVVDRKGALSRRVSMPETQRVVGFGNGTVYTVEIDEDGVQRLRRHSTGGLRLSRVH